MSVVVAIKYDKGMLLGADRQISSGHLASGETQKVYKSQYSNTAWGSVGCLRILDLISCNVDDLMSYKDILDKVELDKPYVVNVIVPKIFIKLKEYNQAYLENNLLSIDNQFLICDYDSIFKIDTDGSVVEHKWFEFGKDENGKELEISEVIEFGKYYAIGSGYELVLGNLQSSYKEDLDLDTAVDLLIDSIRKSCKNELYINSNIDIINITKNKTSLDRFNINSK